MKIITLISDDDSRILCRFVWGKSMDFNKLSKILKLHAVPKSEIIRYKVTSKKGKQTHISNYRFLGTLESYDIDYLRVCFSPLIGFVHSFD